MKQGRLSRSQSSPLLGHLGRLLLVLFLDTSRPRHWGLGAGDAGRGDPGSGSGNRRCPAWGRSESHGLGDSEDKGGEGGSEAASQQAGGARASGDPVRWRAAPSCCPTRISVTRSRASEALKERAVLSSLSRHPRPYSRSALVCPHPTGAASSRRFPAFSVTSAATSHLPDQPPRACGKDPPACGRGPRALAPPS